MEVKISVKELNVKVSGKGEFNIDDFQYEGKTDPETISKGLDTLSRVLAFEALM